MSIVFISNCSDSKGISTNIETHTLFQNGSLELSLDSSISISFNTIQYFNDGNNEFLYLLDWLAMNIIVFDLDQGNVLKKIMLHEIGPNSTGTLDSENSGIFVFAPDSILLHNQNSRKVYLIDSAGTVLKSRIISTMGVSEPFSFLDHPIFENGEHLIFPLRSSLQDPKLSNEHFIMSLNINSYETYNHCNYTDEFDDFSFGFHNYFYEPYLCQFTKNQFIVSFPGTTDIFLYDEDYNKIRNFNLVSDKIKVPNKFHRKVNTNEESFEEHNMFFRTTDVYGRIYNVNNKLFLREIINPPNAEEFKKGSRERKYSFIIMDNDMNILGLYDQFLENTYNFIYSFIDKDGYLNIFNKAKYRLDESKMIFDKYKVIEK